MILRLLICTFFLLPCLGGCGPANPQGRLPITGTVRLNDTPVVSGSISFNSVPNGTGISAGAVIQDGKFSIQREKGLAPGDYIVRIYASEDTGKIDPMTNAPLFKELFPPKYNTASQEKITVSKDSKAFDFNFTVTEADFRR